MKGHLKDPGTGTQMEFQFCIRLGETFPFVLYYGTSLVAQMVKNLPTIQETQIRSLGQEDPLEEYLATHSRNLADKIPRTEEPGRLQSLRSQRGGQD